MAVRFREEITAWESSNTPNHTYIVDGRVLIGYIPQGTKTPVYFNSPKKLWSVTGRKFRDLTKKEIKEYV